MNECKEDAKAKGKKGLVILSADKKRSFLSDPQFLRRKGFLLCDTAPPFFELLYLPFEKGASKPTFKESCKAGVISKKGFVLYYTNQCPHTDKYAPLIAGMAKEKGIAFEMVKIETKGQAQNAPSPFTAYTLYKDGAFVTNEILGPAKFEKMM